MAFVNLGSKAVGSIVRFKVNGATRDWIVVHHGRPNSAYEDESWNGGVVLMMKDIYESRPWNDRESASSNYSGSSIHAYLNSTFKNLIDASIRSKILQVKLPYMTDGNAASVTSGASGLSAYIWLASLAEVGLTGTITK